MRRFLRAPLVRAPFMRASIACAALVLGSALVAPTMVRAFAGGGGALPVSLAARGSLGSFTPASVDPRLMTDGALRALSQGLSHGRLFRFTPAAMDNRPDRAVTVAVRVPGARGRLLSQRLAQGDGGASFASVRIAPIAYNLGVARGYQSFALPTTGPIHDLPRDSSELRSFSLADAAQSRSVTAFAGAKTIGTSPSSETRARGTAPRLSADVAIDERATPGRAPRTLGTQGDYQVRMGGSYRLIGNLDVTAGLRYASDRDRLSALSDHRQDSQAIYVGTKFRF